MTVTGPQSDPEFGAAARRVLRAIAYVDKSAADAWVKTVLRID
jgi:hypothetical protein